MNFQPSQKQGKQFIIYLLVKHQVQMQFLLKSIKLVDFQWQKKLTELFQCMWRKEAIPQDFMDASIIHLYKRKGNPQVCENHRGISLLTIAGKITAGNLDNRSHWLRIINLMEHFRITCGSEVESCQHSLQSKVAGRCFVFSFLSLL